jgi:4-hydroxythreonine-4-phosphate dehydrogenase
MPAGLTNPWLTISMGDPAGIGAEVIVKALADAPLRLTHGFTIHGAQTPMRAAADAANITPFWTSIASDAPRRPGSGQVLLVDAEHSGVHGPYVRDSSLSGDLSFRWVMDAIHDLRSGAQACITAPISKLAWFRAGHGAFPGHTELFASQWRTQRYAMFFHAPACDHGPGLNVLLATVHLPLMQVASKLTRERVAESIELAHETMRSLGCDVPSIGVCGLNPHAGEGGLLGEEDDLVIRPGIEQCAARGIKVSGPHPADTIFQRALHTTMRRAQFDVVVAMYHDQGLVALKTLAWDRAVNTTVGLPIIRTSPDHGTGFDIAGKNLADPGSMRAAISLAALLAARKTAPPS